VDFQRKSIAARRNMGYFPEENPKNFVFRRAISDRPYVPTRQLRLFWSGGYRWCVGAV
jgi:hypothetical protein